MATNALFLNQYISTTLASVGGITDSATSGIILQSITNIDVDNPGVACLSYTDPLDTSKAEWITYTSINNSTKELNGVTRGAEGYAAKAHDNGVTVAFPISKSHINNLNTALMIGGSATNLVEGVLDEDTMSSDSATKLATQQSIKAYVDITTKSIVLPASAMSPTTTAGCASIATVEAGTNDVDYKVLDFDKNTDESAFAIFSMPDSWDGGTITFQPYWTTAGTSGTVVFSLAGRSYANDDAIDQAYGTAQTSTDTFIAAGDIHIGPESSAITLAGTPAGGQLVQLKITRDVSEDTLDADARLIAIKIKYTVDSNTDA